MRNCWWSCILFIYHFFILVINFTKYIWCFSQRVSISGTNVNISINVDTSAFGVGELSDTADTTGSNYIRFVLKAQGKLSPSCQRNTFILTSSCFKRKCESDNLVKLNETEGITIAQKRARAQIYFNRGLDWALIQQQFLFEFHPSFKPCYLT